MFKSLFRIWNSYLLRQTFTSRIVSLVATSEDLLDLFGIKRYQLVVCEPKWLKCFVSTVCLRTNCVLCSHFLSDFVFRRIFRVQIITNTPKILCFYTVYRSFNSYLNFIRCTVHICIHKAWLIYILSIGHLWVYHLFFKPFDEHL